MGCVLMDEEFYLLFSGVILSLTSDFIENILIQNKINSRKKNGISMVRMMNLKSCSYVWYLISPYKKERHQMFGNK